VQPCAGRVNYGAVINPPGKRLHDLEQWPNGSVSG